jgi:hypothetical protein
LGTQRGGSNLAHAEIGSPHGVGDVLEAEAARETLVIGVV